MKQCYLKNKNTHTIAWIPDQFAIKDKIISINDEVWLVASVSDAELDAERFVKQNIRYAGKSNKNQIVERYEECCECF
jgi:hypothetical protein